MIEKRAMRVGILLAFVLIGQASGQTNEAYRASADRPIDILHITLDLDVSLAEQSVAGTATIDFQPHRAVATFTLDAVDLNVSKVREISAKGEPGKSLAFESSGKELEIRFEEPLDREQKKRIEISYSVKEPRSGLHFFKPSEAEPDVPYMVWSQGQPEGNRYWFPCFDRPNERQTTELIARVDSEFTVLSNGQLVRQVSIENGERTEFHWKQEKPHVSYLVTLVAGKFAVVEEKWRGKSITYYVPPGQEENARQTFGRTPEMLDFFSERFGIDYPWEKYAQVVVEQFSSGGMENTSATTLYQAVMHDPRALVDSSPDWLIAHELGHQWWGDLVTCRDWSHLWLNEGFATYCEVLWQEHKLGKDERDYLLYQNSKEARGEAGQERPIVDRRYPSPGSMFDDRAYPKGGWVLHMLRCRLGDADFFRGLKRYGLEYSYSTAETSDFRKVFERLYGVSLERFFYDWTERKGHPKLLIKTTHDPEEGLVRIEVKQTQGDEAFHFPLRIELTKAGEDGKSVSITPLITEKEQTFLLPVKTRPEQVRIDPEFTLLADVTEEKPRGWWVAQLGKGPTVPERLRAVEHFAKTPSAVDREILIEAVKNDPFYAIRAEAAQALGKTRQGDVKVSLKLALKEKHPKVRRAVVEALGHFENDKELAEVLLAAYEQGDESYYVEAAILESLAKMLDPPPREILEKALKEDSHRDIIRTKALNGLAKCPDVEVLETLSTWTKLGHPSAARMAAMNALAESLKTHDFPKEKQTEAVELLASYLKETGPRIRRAAIAALTAVPHLAQSEKDRLSNMAENDVDGRVRTAATNAVKKLGESTSPAQVQKLQTELQKLQEQYKKLDEQIQKLQAQGK